MTKRLLTAIALTSAVLIAGSAEARHGKMTKVEVLKSQQVTMEDGKTSTVMVVKMNGHMMVGIPADDVPAALHQQLFRYGEN